MQVKLHTTRHTTKTAQNCDRPRATMSHKPPPPSPPTPPTLADADTAARTHFCCRWYCSGSLGHVWHCDAARLSSTFTSSAELSLKPISCGAARCGAERKQNKPTTKDETIRMDGRMDGW